jgi:hypothetical protein
MRVDFYRRTQRNPFTGIKNLRSKATHPRSTSSASCTRIAKNWRANAACGAQLRMVSRKRSFGLVLPMTSTGLESQISKRRLSGSKKLWNMATLTLKLNWEDAMKMARPSSKTMFWLPSGIEKRQNTFRTWGGAGQGRNRLGLLYREGFGVPKDYVQAYMWFSLSNAEENVAAVREEMNPQQILKAQQLAEEWKRQQLEPAIY